MDIFAAFLPQGLQYEPEDVCIVVDAVRAGATLVAMAEAGDPRVYLAASAADARAYRDACRPTALLGGEVGGLPPAGFDLGNSPAEWRALDLAGREVVFGTSNGTRTVAACSVAGEVLIGCFLNVTAVAARAAAAGASRIKIVCAGSRGFICLDDSVCAGLIAARLVALGGSPADSAIMAIALSERLSDIPAVLRQSESGRWLARAGLAKDLDDCARVDSSDAVPALAKGEFARDRRLKLIG